MAKITLDASLDLSKVTEQLNKLKSEGSIGISLDKGFKDEFNKIIKDAGKTFADTVKEQLKTIKIDNISTGTISATKSSSTIENTPIGTTSKSSSRGSRKSNEEKLAEYRELAEGRAAIQAEVREKAAKQRQELRQSYKGTPKEYTYQYDKERQKEVRLEKGQIYSELTGKKYWNKDIKEQAETHFREMSKVDKKLSNKQIKYTKDVIKLKSELEQNSLKRLATSFKNYIKTGNFDLGSAASRSALVRQFPGSSAAGMVRGGRVGRLLGTGASSLMRGAGLLGAGAMAAYGAVQFGRYSYASGRNMQRTIAERQNETTLSAMQGRGAELGAIRRGRAATTGFQKFLGGLSGAAGALGTLRLGDFWTGKGSQAGRAEEELAMSQLQQAKEAPFTQAKQRFLSTIPQRLSTMAGGNLSGAQLNSRIMGGAEFGFSPEQTMQQLSAARGALGGKQVGGLMFQDMQRLERLTGLGTGEQAGIMESLKGVQSGVGTSRAFNQQVEIIKKGMAAGLDQSKTGKYLQVTSDYLSGTAGFANINADDIATRLAGFASGFAGAAGRSDITMTDVSRAQSMRDIFQKESMGTTGGLAAAGKHLAIQNTFGNIGQDAYLNLSRLSSNATEADIAQALGITGPMSEQQQKQASQFRNILQGSMSKYGGQQLGISSGMTNYMRSSNYNMPIEQLYAMNRADTTVGPTRAAAAQMGFDESIFQTEEFRNQQLFAQKEAQQTQAGFVSLKDINKDYKIAIDEAITALQKWTAALGGDVKQPKFTKAPSDPALNYSNDARGTRGNQFDTWGNVPDFGPLKGYFKGD